MRCLAENDPRWSAWLDSELEETAGREIDQHLTTCSGCRELAANLRSLGTMLHAELEPDPGFLVRFRARRDEMSVASFWTWRQFALRLLPLAVAVLIAALWTVLLSSPDDGTLELDALGGPTAFSAEGPSEPVLTIALEPFPLDMP
jgi:anti-sigma factor RsiW